MVGLAGCERVAEVLASPPIHPSPVASSPPEAPSHQTPVVRKRKVARRIKLPRDNFRVSPADLVWGRSQVDLMMRNRPEMGLLVKKGDPIYEFAARQFGGASCHRHIHWDPISPPGEYPADNSMYEGISRIRIQISTAGGHRLNAQELWACAIFELINSSHQDGWLKQFKLVTEGHFLRDEFIWAVAGLEYLTARRVKRFYLDCWEPFLAAKGRAGEPQFWYLDLPGTVKGWRESYDRIGYPYSTYGPYYDHLQRVRHWKECAEDDYARAVTEMERRLASKENRARLQAITDRASRLAFREEWANYKRERAQHGYRMDPALVRWYAHQEELSREPVPESSEPEPPATRLAGAPPEIPQPEVSRPVRPQVRTRPGEHPGETEYSNADDSAFRVTR